MSKISIKNYSINNNACIILDTNILIHLFYPVMRNNSNMHDYEVLWGHILSSNTKPLLPAIQVSEFINRCIRFQYTLYKNIHESNIDYKKDYRNTDDYRTNMNDILNIVKDEIIPHFSIISDNFDKANPNKLYIYGFSYDFNDALLVSIAEEYKADLVTHDSDFANYNTKINLISSNTTLLMFS